MHSTTIGDAGLPDVVMAHGWDRTHADFILAAESLAPVARCHLLDLPGFGASPRPEASWGTADYADHVAEEMQQRLGRPFLWVGHSLGGRIGLRLGVHHGRALTGLVLVAPAGVPRRRSEWQKLRGDLRGAKFRFLRKRAKDEAEVIELEKKYGSIDYVHSRETGLRDIFLNTVNEDQSLDIGRITTPTSLVFGAEDSETPPELGLRMQRLIPGSSLTVVPGLDHISVLFRGRHQLAAIVKDMLRETGQMAPQGGQGAAQ
ncbi:alpha/beta fold hydrolase [Pseudooceanicola sp. 502str34]|uniref:alpha/beta fold hydrolase n=1 Tax=Maritimibacter alkaliphilus TaxID=404236 RepID=UPI001C9850EB|nr:alpha/beta hydrolase [Maritimibacter alkaliphilus]MBY6089732.1 alpha/beta hydrolase [Maritimibacter alkaliphilus]